MSAPLISTVVLNWNRADLLRRTVESYLATVSVPYELTIVDNASEDDSRRFITELENRHPSHKAVYLDRNLGGEAINRGLENAHGRFLHISENDMKYLPGWDVAMMSKFEVFPELGQLSLLSPFPEWDRGEIWEPHVANPVRRDSHTIFVTGTNVTTSSWIRRACWDAGFRWHTLPAVEGNPFRFPDDGRASADIRAQGYWTAWNDTYVARNYGHSIDEFMRRLDYYLANYAAKGWFGLEGWRKRLNDNGYDLIATETGYRIVRL